MVEEEEGESISGFFFCSTLLPEIWYMVYLAMHMVYLAMRMLIGYGRGHVACAASITNAGSNHKRRAAALAK